MHYAGNKHTSQVTVMCVNTHTHKHTHVCTASFCKDINASLFLIFMQAHGGSVFFLFIFTFHRIDARHIQPTRVPPFPPSFFTSGAHLYSALLTLQSHLLTSESWWGLASCGGSYWRLKILLTQKKKVILLSCEQWEELLYSLTLGAVFHHTFTPCC